MLEENHSLEDKIQEKIEDARFVLLMYGACTVLLLTCQILRKNWDS